MNQTSIRYFVAIFLCFALQTASVSYADLKVQPLLRSLDSPWGMAFLPDGEVLITMKEGALLRTDLQNKNPRWIEGLPDSSVKGQGGMLDVALHPNFETNHWIYLTFTRKVSGGYTTALARGVLKSNSLDKVVVLFTANAVNTGGRHFGSRLAFDNQGYLYMTVGDRGEREFAQDLLHHNGKVLRFHDDGRIPEDNPYVGRLDALQEIYTYGHRNPQGLVFDERSGRMWLHEHGPRGGDELNLLKSGANYGWPVVTYGREYSGFSITDKTEMPGVESPVFYWDPSIAPSGLTIYRGNLFSDWEGDLIVGALKYQLVTRVQMSGDIALGEERYLGSRNERIRDVDVGADGALYVLTDGNDAQLWRVLPE
ncbi:PQQ-dependent sugar dehydrogenase [Hahella ganghwensis]|uniref:PQQ-dependent sugar dehydrogenase n=1 Tax=Hahella ganghwensis TaxID=286420 RepID=UPI00036D0438|nr:PQQ-dependent sugar dehydrogenase [Hahella ganghwensis]